ncbi:MAG: TetR/AcrR family transcriptional regulator [Bacteroidetes bacterium]|nr:MAG: TetR/AcrR family transcriptional regulator [Bacteroidota bacterium]
MDKLNTENKILQAAEDEFIEQGYSGARMQAIANKAGINKALLHYYFRSKQKLFEMIFKTAFKLFIPKILGVFERNDIDFFEKIKVFTSEYINIIIKNPHIPGFILHELGTKKSSLATIILDQAINIEPIKLQIEAEIEKGTIKSIMPEQLVMNIIALCVFPIVAAPIGEVILFQGNTKKYQDMIQARKNHVAEFVINSIKS